ncbi:hypothetical protein N7495_000979 [Penicillium taxi]|uniref:uncharacterized protein n=1 Tax=Penicillium taxi TaxID=168475 RepID=UPI002544F5DA|nr:uncharacterized protein N7495_000979 [Penicillium taxi]KAJ5908297.1 hypothetical protein N7495_000979 [Penicillium taxi]
MVSTQELTAPVALDNDTIYDIICDARAGAIEDLSANITSLASQHNCSEAQIVAAAIDAEEESEGGTGCCVLHYPAANGETEILNFLLKKLEGVDVAQRTAFINHRNNSGNTPLHWAALNTHLEAVKALVETGADVSIKNDAGHDAVFLAERAAWSASAEEVEETDETEEIEVTIGDLKVGEEGQAESEEAPAEEMSAGRQVVEWLLSSEKSASLESSANEGSSA